MAEQSDKGKQDTQVKPGKQESQVKSAGLNIRFTAVDNSDQPVLANVTRISAAPGMAFIDFGFIEPTALAQISHLMQSGGKAPETLTGRLAVRVALTYDVLNALHQQIGQVIGSLQQQRAAGAAPAKKGA